MPPPQVSKRKLRVTVTPELMLMRAMLYTSVLRVKLQAGRGSNSPFKKSSQDKNTPKSSLSAQRTICSWKQVSVFF